MVVSWEISMGDGDVSVLGSMKTFIISRSRARNEAVDESETEELVGQSRRGHGKVRH